MNNQNHIFALDYDHTFSLNPTLWKLFINMCKSNNIEVMIVTMRYETPDEADEVKQAINGLVPIIFCNRRWKKQVCEEKGIKISVWIDDMPAAIEDQRELYIRDYKSQEIVHIWDWLSK